MADQIVFMRSIINSRTLKELQYAKSVFAGAASISQGVIYLLSDNIPTSVPKTIVLGMFSDMESDINGITAKSYGWNVIYNKSFHAKILIIEKKKSHVIYMGSSNLTGAANDLALNLEMNIRYECKNLPSQIRKLIKECKNSTSNLDEKVLNNNLTNVNKQINDKIRELLEGGYYIGAVKYYRNETGAGLKESKDYVDGIRSKYGK